MALTEQLTLDEFLRLPEEKPALVAERIRALAAELEVQEIAVVTWTHDEAVRRRSYELLAREFGLG